MHIPAGVAITKIRRRKAFLPCRPCTKGASSKLGRWPLGGGRTGKNSEYPYGGRGATRAEFFPQGKRHLASFTIAPSEQKESVGAGSRGNLSRRFRRPSIMPADQRLPRGDFLGIIGRWREEGRCAKLKRPPVRQRKFRGRKRADRRSKSCAPNFLAPRMRRRRTHRFMERGWVAECVRSAKMSLWWVW